MSESLREEMTPSGGVEEPATASDTEGSALVIIGVKPDEWSREVLTWSLVNVARPGDRIVALHVLDYSLGFYLVLDLSLSLSVYFVFFFNLCLFLLLLCRRLNVACFAGEDFRHYAWCL